jgi:hypothetical protein
MLHARRVRSPGNNGEMFRFSSTCRWQYVERDKRYALGRGRKLAMVAPQPPKCSPASE